MGCGTVAISLMNSGYILSWGHFMGSKLQALCQMRCFSMLVYFSVIGMYSFTWPIQLRFESTNDIMWVCGATLPLMSVSMTTALLFPRACVGSYLRPHRQGCIEGLHSFVELSTEVVQDPEACLQIRVDVVRVVLNCFQEELLDLGLQGTVGKHTHTHTDKD